MITEKELTEKYWYKSQLMKFCDELNILKSGTKAELQYRLLKYLQTGQIDKTPPATIVKKKNTQISLESYFIKDGLKFNNELRYFISKYLKVKKISFTKYMGAAVREAKKDGTDITINELIEIYNRPKSSFLETDEDKTYQWNNFVRDFFNSIYSRKYSNKLKVASILWNIAKKEVNKIYSDDLLKNNKEVIDEYLNK